MQIDSIFHHLKFLEEVAILTEREWGHYQNEEEFQKKLKNKMRKIMSHQNRNDYEKLILFEGDQLIGFISIFPADGEERSNLTPWYATMYVKEEYRGRGYSKILSDSILREAKRRGYHKIYLKSNLVDYYAKLGAIYVEDLKEEKLFYFPL